MRAGTRRELQKNIGDLGPIETYNSVPKLAVLHAYRVVTVGFSRLQPVTEW